MKYTIFYSWQSDLPNNTNRGFVESVILKAIKDVKNTEEYELEPSFDRDTQGIPGAPNITQAILDKIKTCDAFVADISIVTGDKEKSQRPSPNPNVLLELGYAIALLGWEKIILFSNDVYGTDEDLPFDIRQHRRIGYELQQEDAKADIRKNLTAHFKDRLIELLKKGKANSHTKQPSLLVEWNFWDIVENHNSDVGVDSEKINLHRVDVESGLKVRVRKEIKKAKEIDGSIDPEWSKKLETYINSANDFINDIDVVDKYNNYLINAHVGKTYPLTLTVENNGNTSASDIRVEIPLPEWLIGFGSYPSKEETPKIPKTPSPVPPRATNIMSAFGNITNMGNMFDPSLLSRNINRTSACYLKKDSIYFWADKMLHKHSITNRSERFYLLAMPEAPTGEIRLEGKAFCSEYDDWHQIELIVNIV